MDDISTDDLISRNRDLLAEAALVRAQFRDLDARVEADMAKNRANREYWRRWRETMLSQPGAIHGPPFAAKAPETND